MMAAVRHNGRRVLWLAVIGLSAGGRLAWGHGSGVLLQDGFGTLVTGDAAANRPSFVEERIFSAFFPELLAWNEPSFLSQAMAPEGTLPLAENAEVAWDFLPLTIDGVTSNLWHWDGQGGNGTAIALTPSPGPRTTLTLFGRNNVAASADGTDRAVGGPTLAHTLSGSGLRLHAHQFFFLDDPSSPPAPGLYLISMQLRMASLDGSKPIYLVFGTPETAPSARDALVEWILPRVDQLVRDGDYDFNGVVDARDFLTWQRQFGSNVVVDALGDSADGDANNLVDEEDRSLWETHWGVPLASPVLVQAVARSVPEPAAWALLMAGIAGLGRMGRPDARSSHRWRPR